MDRDAFWTARVTSLEWDKFQLVVTMRDERTDDRYFKGIPQNVGSLEAARASGDTSTGD